MAILPPGRREEAEREAGKGQQEETRCTPKPSTNNRIPGTNRAERELISSTVASYALAMRCPVLTYCMLLPGDKRKSGEVNGE
eukprot:3166562-Rhodomonas_salina.2